MYMLGTHQLQRVMEGKTVERVVNQGLSTWEPCLAWAEREKAVATVQWQWLGWSNIVMHTDNQPQYRQHQNAKSATIMRRTPGICTLASTLKWTDRHRKRKEMDMVSDQTIADMDNSTIISMIIKRYAAMLTTCWPKSDCEIADTSSWDSPHNPISFLITLKWPQKVSQGQRS